MTKVFFFLTLLLISQSGFPVEKMTLENPIDFAKILANNNVFLKECNFFDWGSGFLYFLDTRYGMVFKVEENTGKLIKTISSKGQGPSELQYPKFIRVRNRKIFIVDVGFNGIKVFDTGGKILNEIKFSKVLGHYASIDVNEKDEIFVGRVDTKNNTMVSVYNLNGEKLRSIIPYKPMKSDNKISPTWYYRIRLDKTGNIYVLHFLLRTLSKYDKEGKLLWVSNIKNKILDNYPTRNFVKRGENNTIRIRKSVFGLDVTPNNNVVVGHVSGGCLFSSNGDLLKLIAFEKPKNLSEFRIIGNRLINLLIFGEIVEIYDFKEE